MKSKIWQEIRSMSVVEVQSKLRESEDNLFKLRFKHTTTPLKNGLEIRTIKRNIARFKTLLHEKSIAAGK
ncbi:MAG: 50S ribosomal protein L29 [Elusimicrobiota bacterium]